MRVGLLGGSFNPPHEAHRAISLFAIKRLKLDRVWWLVTPGNPLKDDGALRDLDQRTGAARAIANDPRIDVSCLEAVIGTRYTIDTITYLRRRACGLRFVWIMGADNLAQFQSLERLAAHRSRSADRGDRPSVAKFSGTGGARRSGACPLPPSREPGRQSGGPARAGLGVSHRPETEPVIDRPSEPGRQLEDEK